MSTLINNPIIVHDYVGGCLIFCTFAAISQKFAASSDFFLIFRDFVVWWRVPFSHVCRYFAPVWRKIDEDVPDFDICC